jgi:RND family efflux transporter MFP subunit
MKKVKKKAKEVINFLKEKIKTTKGKIIFGVFIVVIVLLVVKLFSGKKDKTQVQTEMVTKGTIVSSVTASGSITSANIENITTQASGTVKKVYVNDGDMVKKGQLIAQIELDTEGKQNYAQAYSSYLSAVVGLNSARNSLRSAEASAEKVLDDVKGHDSDETYAQKETRTKAEVARDNAYDSVKTAEAKLNSASLDFQSSSPNIYATVAGKVKSVTVAEGMNLGAEESASGSTANQRIATIATEGLPIASVNVSEIEVTSITTGQKATITLDSISDKTFTGKVVSVDRVGSTSNNVTTYPVIIKFDTNSEQILPNMATTANIIIESKNDVLLVSSSAVKYQGDQAYVILLKDGKQQDVNIEVGISNDTQIEVSSGLSENDVIVLESSSSTSTTSNRQTTTGSSIFGGGEIRVPGAGQMR